MALPKAGKVGRRGDLADAVAEGEDAAAAQRRRPRGISLAASDGDQDLDEANQDRGAAGGILPDHVPHGVGQPVVIDRRDDQHNAAAAQPPPAGEGPSGELAQRRPEASTPIAVCGSVLPGDSARIATSTR